MIHYSPRGTFTGFLRNTRDIFPDYSGGGWCHETIVIFLRNSKWDVYYCTLYDTRKNILMLDSVFEVPTEEEHWAMSEEVSVSLHTEKEISYTGMKTKKM